MITMITMITFLAIERSNLSGWQQLTKWSPVSDHRSSIDRRTKQEISACCDLPVDGWQLIDDTLIIVLIIQSCWCSLTSQLRSSYDFDHHMVTSSVAIWSIIFGILSHVLLDGSHTLKVNSFRRSQGKDLWITMWWLQHLLARRGPLLSTTSGLGTWK